ncbi:MAG TPA: MarR family transcriptional regulator [Solirubrobacterales bacterium]|nr:MarR family transcriptional regulator [Solirubrobacterales bacterium]
MSNAAKTDSAALAAVQVAPEVRETAVRVGVLFRHLLSYGDGGQSLREIDRHGLTFVQFKALMSLSSADPEDPPYLQELAEELGASMPSLSRAIDGLVRKDLVSRIEDPEDRRRRRISLTESGREIANHFFQSRASGVVRFASSLSEEQREALDSAIGQLLDRDDIAPIYDEFEGVVPK